MRRRELLKKIFVAIILFIHFTYSVQGYTAVDVKPFRCEMSAPVVQQLSQGVYLIFTITNLTDHKLKLLSWYTPFEGFLSDLFIIESDVGEPLDYNGMMVKRSKPTIDDYVVLLAKEKAEVKLDLTQVYTLAQGEYTVQLASRSWRYMQQELSFTNQCVANRLKIKVSL